MSEALPKEGNHAACREVIRALVLGDQNEYERKLDALSSADAEPLSNLLFAAFSIAVRRGFDERYSVPDVINFVADLRLEAPSSTRVRASVAERMVRAALGEPHLAEGLAEEDKMRAQAMFLLLLTSDEREDAEAMERFLENAARSAARMAGSTRTR